LEYLECVFDSSSNSPSSSAGYGTFEELFGKGNITETNTSKLKKIVVHLRNTTVYTYDAEEQVELEWVQDNHGVIKNNTFKGLTNVETIIIDGEYTSIGMSAFEGCTNLKSVIIPETLTSIGAKAFKDCTSLESFSIPAAVTEILGSAFEGCSSLNYVYFAESTGQLAIYGKTFKNCTELESIAFPSTYSSLVLGDALFEGCASLESLTLKDLMNDFSYNQMIRWVSEDPTSEDADLYNTWFNTSTGDVFYVIGGSWELAFNVKPYSTSTIHHADDPSNSLGNDGDVCLGSYNEVYYRIKVNGAWSDKLYVGQYSIGYLFSESGDNSLLPESLKTVVLSTHLNETYAYSFAGCEYLETVILPEDIVYIGAHAFEECYSLNHFDMPTSLAFIGDYAFHACMMLGDLYIYDVAVIGEEAFSESGITSLCLFNVNEIKTGAFVVCQRMTELVLIDTENIGMGAFNGCRSLKKVDITVTSTSGIDLYIGDCAFQDCHSLSELDINSYVTIKSLGYQAFMDCTSLPYIDLSNADCDTIGNSAFRDCASLSYAVIGDTVNTIGNAAFDGCRSLAYVEIGAGVNNIGDFAFNNCLSLATLNIKSTQMMTFGTNSVFKNCYSLTKVVYNSTKANWEANFYNQLNASAQAWFRGVKIVCTDLIVG